MEDTAVKMSAEPARESEAIPVEKKTSTRAALRRLGSVLQPERWRLILATAAIHVGNLVQLSFPIVTSFLVDRTMGLSGGAGNVYSGYIQQWFESLTLHQVGLWLALVMIIVVGCRFIEQALFHSCGERAMSRLRAQIFQKLLRAPLAFHARHRVGEVVSRLLGDLTQVQEHWVNDLRQIQTHGITVIGSLILMTITAPKLALVLAAAVPLCVGVGIFFGKRLRREAQSSQARAAESAIILEETLQGIQTVKACGADEWEIARYQRSLAEGLRPAVRGARQRALFLCGIVFVMLSAWIYLMWHGSRMIEVRPDHSRELTPGAFTAFMFFLGFTLSSGGTLAEVFSRWPKALSAAGRVIDLLDTPSETDAPNAISGQRLRGQVSLKNVSFEYPGRLHVSVLCDISLEVAPGERIAIVGASGAGKSTLVALIARLYDATHGTIELDGRSVSAYARAWLRRQIAFVPQEVILIGGTIEENIAYGDVEASPEKIRTAADQAHARDFIEALPDGWQTVVGERGSQLSGGQRQRVALARAFVRDPSILILDEATSALDAENELLVQAALTQLSEGRTTFIIAHRLATVRRADRIVVMDSGRLVEVGTHAELYAAGGRYRQLCDHQLSPSEEVVAPA
jgi:ABC-type multidrug transport system fused ATPase/permease subunit